jgi:hypothetical protein
MTTVRQSDSPGMKRPFWSLRRIYFLPQLLLFKCWGGDTAGSMSQRGELNEFIHTVATAAGWGLYPPENAMYTVVHQNMDPNKLCVTKYKTQVSDNGGSRIVGGSLVTIQIGLHP